MKKKETSKLKRGMALAVATVLCIGLTACGQGNGAVSSTGDQSMMSNEVSTSATVSEPKEEKNIFQQFGDALEERGVVFEKVQMASEMIGAEQGVKYEIGDGAVELYRFDPESDAYQNAEENQAVTLDGFGGVEAVVKNGKALVITDLDNEDIYVEIFDALS